jgi:hypothetical protein
MPAIHAVSPQLRFEIPHFDLKRTSSNFSNFILMLVGVYGLILEFASRVCIRRLSPISVRVRTKLAIAQPNSVRSNGVTRPPLAKCV